MQCFQTPKWEWEKVWRKNTTLSIQSESGPENNETETLFNELFHFHFINIPPPGPQRKLVYHFLLHRCVFPAVPLGSPLGDQHELWTLPPLTALRGHLSSPVLSGNDQQTLPSCQVGLMLRGPSFKRPPFCPMAAPAGHSATAARGFPSWLMSKEGLERLLRASVQRSHNQPNNTRLFSVSNSFSSAPPPPLPLREN